MTELTNDQQFALKEVRIALYERLTCYKFSEKQLEPRSLYHLISLLHLVGGHRNWLGRFTDTIYVLVQIFGVDAIHDEPKPESEKTALVN